MGRILMNTGAILMNGRDICSMALRIEMVASYSIHGRSRRTTVIHGGELVAVMTRRLLMRLLLGCGLNMMVSESHLFLCGRPCGNTARSAIITGVIVNGSIMDHRTI